MFGILLQDQLSQLANGKPPQPMRLNEFDAQRLLRDEFDAASEMPLGFMMAMIHNNGWVLET